MEVEVRDAWKPVIRYDRPMDMRTLIGIICVDGRKRKRLALSFSEALTRAERDIKQNWSVYREQFLRGEWP